MADYNHWLNDPANKPAGYNNLDISDLNTWRYTDPVTNKTYGIESIGNFYDRSTQEEAFQYVEIQPDGSTVPVTQGLRGGHPAGISPNDRINDYIRYKQFTDQTTGKTYYVDVNDGPSDSEIYQWRELMPGPDMPVGDRWDDQGTDYDYKMI